MVQVIRKAQVQQMAQAQAFMGGDKAMERLLEIRKMEAYQAMATGKAPGPVGGATPTPAKTPTLEVTKAANEFEQAFVALTKMSEIAAKFNPKPDTITLLMNSPIMEGVGLGFGHFIRRFTDDYFDRRGETRAAGGAPGAQQQRQRPANPVAGQGVMSRNVPPPGPGARGGMQDVPGGSVAGVPIAPSNPEPQAIVGRDQVSMGPPVSGFIGGAYGSQSGTLPQGSRPMTGPVLPSPAPQYNPNPSMPTLPAGPMKLQLDEKDRQLFSQTQGMVQEMGQGMRNLMDMVKSQQDRIITLESRLVKETVQTPEKVKEATDAKATRGQRMGKT